MSEIKSADRRLLLKSGLALGAAAATGAVSAPATAQPKPAHRIMPAQTTWGPVPRQAPATERMIQVQGAKLWCWDTGGEGEPVVFLHPGTGSAAIWGYQQPVFAAAGYRMIAYSRRGYFKSESGPADAGGRTIDDLQAIVDELGLKRFHLVGLAAGGFSVPDYALSYPERLLSITLACSLGGVSDPEYSKITQSMQPPGFADLPQYMREIGPSYRAANPHGVEEWEALERSAQHTPVRQTMVNRLSWTNIEKIRTPTLLLTGDADMYMPPSRQREQAKHFKAAETVVVCESGHAVTWEQPKAFNAAVINFIRRHGERTASLRK